MSLQQQTCGTITDLVSYIQCLSVAFNVPAPGITCTKRRKRSVYHRSKTKSEIRFSGNILSEIRDAKYVATHEFAHHLDAVRRHASADEFGNLVRGPGSPKRTAHDRTFYKILLEVIDKAYSSRSEYPWWREYKTLAKWAWEYRDPQAREKREKLQLDLLTERLFS